MLPRQGHKHDHASPEELSPSTQVRVSQNAFFSAFREAELSEEKEQQEIQRGNEWKQKEIEAEDYMLMVALTSFENHYQKLKNQDEIKACQDFGEIIAKEVNNKKLRPLQLAEVIYAAIKAIRPERTEDDVRYFASKAEYFQGFQGRPEYRVIAKAMTALATVLLATVVGILVAGSLPVMATVGFGTSLGIGVAAVAGSLGLYAAADNLNKKSVNKVKSAKVIEDAAEVFEEWRILNNIIRR